MNPTPSRLTLWRWLLTITSPLAWLALADAFSLAQKLKLAPLASKSWLVLLGALILLGAGSLLALLLSFTPAFAPNTRLHQALKVIADLPGRLRTTLSGLRPLGYPVLLLSLLAYPVILFQPYYANLLAKQTGLRMLLFWALALLGAQALRLALPRLPGIYALLIELLLQATVQQVSLYLPDISAYPFAMGWSETSRFYWPSLFAGRLVFGQPVAWPILHPSLHFLLLPPYLLEAPLWFHRFWQVAMRFLLVGLIAPALIYRLNIQSRGLRWLNGVWIFLCLFTLPLYLHLAVPVFIMLWGFSAKNDRRTWFWLSVASIWAGLSRLNWYPMPGMLAAALYFLEVPAANKGWKYLIKPALWCLVGTALAVGAMQIYIALSGIPNPADFYTSLSSTKLWYRLWPNESYSMGVLAGILIFSTPFGLVLFASWRRMRAGINARSIAPLAWLMLLAELLVLFAGGLVVSTKIGGGADIHNMDAYAVLLLIITASLLFGPRQQPAAPGAVEAPRPNSSTPPWLILALLVIIPAWFSVQGTAQFWQYDPASSQATLNALQKQVDQVNAQGGQILFITQRQLISMHMLTGVKLVQEYEREELMEMAMAQNDAYLQRFRTDLENHRFAAIVVDPLRFNLVGDQDAMGAENNAWTRAVVKKVLCNYQQAAIFPADRIAIYVPQTGPQKCP